LSIMVDCATNVVKCLCNPLCRPCKKPSDRPPTTRSVELESQPRVEATYRQPMATLRDAGTLAPLEPSEGRNRANSENSIIVTTEITIRSEVRTHTAPESSVHTVPKGDESI
jgi:hypothetical protein